MAEYIPTPGPLPGEQYMPSNGTEGGCFLEGWCSRCARDKELNGTVAQGGDDTWCPIVAASFRDEAVEWRELENGDTICTAFVPMGQPVPPPRDEYTVDMFAPASQGGADD